jgi:hypothetical protein
MRRNKATVKKEKKQKQNHIIAGEQSNIGTV